MQVSVNIDDIFFFAFVAEVVFRRCIVVVLLVVLTHPFEIFASDGVVYSVRNKGFFRSVRGNIAVLRYDIAFIDNHGTGVPFVVPDLHFQNFRSYLDNITACGIQVYKFTVEVVGIDVEGILARSAYFRGAFLAQNEDHVVVFFVEYIHKVTERRFERRHRVADIGHAAGSHNRIQTL